MVVVVVVVAPGHSQSTPAQPAHANRCDLSLRPRAQKGEMFVVAPAKARGIVSPFFPRMPSFLGGHEISSKSARDP